MKTKDKTHVKKLNAADQILILYIWTKAKYLTGPGWAGSLFSDYKPQRNFLGHLLGLTPSAVRNPLRCRKGKTLINNIMETKAGLTQAEINEYTRRLNNIKMEFHENFYPDCIPLIDKRLHDLNFMIPIDADK